MVRLYDYQLAAISKMANGCILYGGVGTGKSITALSYYYEQCGGARSFLTGGRYIKPHKQMDLYIITTAKKRDSDEWNDEVSNFGWHEGNNGNFTIVIDSWNNIKKYAKADSSFFIFDEQRVVGYGAWSKAFIEISKHNKWILLSATPGDTWMDYIPVFIANGFYKNKSEFLSNHVIYSRFSKYPKVDRYVNTKRLERLRDNILVPMARPRKIETENIDMFVEYDRTFYKDVLKNRWNYEKEEPIETASELCHMLRKIVNSDPSRLKAVKDIFEKKKRVIVFYNYDFELELLKSIDYGSGVEVAEWNGHKHQPIPDTDTWVYLVNYIAGAEGWNCITTDTIIFFSQNYSYKTVTQAAGRIDRINTKYEKLYYYHIKSYSSIDLAISNAYKTKKKFNEQKFASTF